MEGEQQQVKDFLTDEEMSALEQPAAKQADFLTDDQMRALELDAARHAPMMAAMRPAAPVYGSPIARAAGSFAEMIDPRNIVQAAAHPWQTAKTLATAQWEQLKSARTLAGEGSGLEAAGHLMAGLLPGFGPLAANAGEQIGQGNLAEGLGMGAGLVVPGILASANKLAVPVANLARKSAVGNYLAALDARGLASKVRAVRTARELATRKIVGTRETLDSQAAAAIQGLNQQRNAALVQLAGTNLKIQPALDAIDQLMDDKAIVHGVVVDEALMQAGEDAKKVLTELGPSVDAKDLDQVKQIFSGLANRQSAAYARAPGQKDVSPVGQAHRAGAAALADELHQASPDLAKIDKEWSFWKDVRDLSQRAILNRQGQTFRSGVTALGDMAIGGTALSMTHDPIKAVAAALITHSLQRAVESGRWATISGAIKSTLADLMMQPDLRAAALLSGRLAGAAAVAHAGSVSNE